MGTMTSQITSLTVVYSTICWGADQRKCQRSASLAYVRGIQRWPVNSPQKWPVTRKIFPFDDGIMACHWLCLVAGVTRSGKNSQVSCDLRPYDACITPLNIFRKCTNMNHIVTQPALWQLIQIPMYRDIPRCLIEILKTAWVDSN